MNTIRDFGLAGLAAILIAPGAGAQQPPAFEIPESGAPISAEDLRTLVGPVALYADDLVGIILPASTYPLQIVQASRFLDRLETDSSLQPDPEWDEAVVALLNYPEVLRLMDQNIEWTWALGGAVLDEQAAVLDAIQAFRRDALLAGNLTSNQQQQVSENDGLIEIAPADPEVIYIPYYEPERVVVVQPRPVVHFYTRAYPLYYYPYPYGYSFHASYFWGVTTAFNIGWHSHTLHVYHHRHHSHPYYGRVYYSPWYPRYHVNVYRSHNVWQPRHRPAARPYRSATRVRSVASREGQSHQRVYSSQSQPRSERNAANVRSARTPAPALAQPRTRNQSLAARPSGGQVTQRSGAASRGNVVVPRGNPSTQARQNRSSAAAPRYGDNSQQNSGQRYGGSRPLQPPAGTNNRQPQRPAATIGTRSNASRQSGAASRQPRTFGSVSAGAGSSRSAQGAAARTQHAQRSPARSAGGGAGAGRTRR